MSGSAGGLDRYCNQSAGELGVELLPRVGSSHGYLGFWARPFGSEGQRASREEPRRRVPRYVLPLSLSRSQSFVVKRFLQNLDCSDQNARRLFLSLSPVEIWSTLEILSLNALAFPHPRHVTVGATHVSLAQQQLLLHIHARVTLSPRWTMTAGPD